MKKLLGILFILNCFFVNAQKGQFKKAIKKTFKFATFYGAINGGNSVSDVDVYSVTNGLETSTIKTPFDYSISLGVRKIARFGYETRANAFYDGTEKSYGDAATIGKVKGFEFLFEADYRRQQGKNFLDQDHFLRYVGDYWIGKVEYLQDGFADIEYFEISERYRYKVDKKGKLSLNVGAVQRLSEPYGYNPLDEWMLSNGNLHYTDLALQEGYNIEFDGLGGTTYLNPAGSEVATSNEVWEALVIPQVLSDYTEKKRNELQSRIEYSFVIGFDFYHFTDNFWLHSWANVLPYHINTGDTYSYHRYNGGQWVDYSGGLIFGYKFNRHLGCFVEGKYHKYWNRTWHDFKLGINYVVF